MKISKRIIKGIALGMCALILSLSISSACLPVYAEEVTLSAKDLSIEKIVDMSLTNTGIVASPAIVAKIVEKILNAWSLVVNAYDTFCSDNGLEKSCDTLAEFIASDSYTVIGYKAGILEYLRDSGNNENLLYYLDSDVYEECIVGYSVGDKVHGGGGLRREFTISSDFVEYVRQLFNEYSETDADFYYIDTVGPEDVHPGWFPDKTSYERVVKVLGESTCPVVIDLVASANGLLSTESDNTFCSYHGTWKIFSNGLFLVDCGDYANYKYVLKVYDDDWDTANYYTANIGNWAYHSYETFDDLVSYCTSYYATSEVTCKLEYSDTHVSLGVCTNDGRKMKVFKDASTMKLYDVGRQSYYITNNSDEYETNNDNSVTFSGDYYTSTGDEYTYDIVQNEIDNSTEINEETVNNIVNEQTTTIINNYYTSSDSGDDGSGGSSGAGITDLIESIGGILDVVLSAIAGLINLLTTFIDSALTLLSSLGNSFAGFSSLLGALFVFIPADLIDSIKAGLSLLIVLAVYKFLKK